MPPLLSMIVTASDNGVIGHRGAKPWHNPLEAERLERYTYKRPVILGRKTFRGTPNLPQKRWYFVLSNDPEWLENGSHRDFEGYGYFFCSGFEAALGAARAIAEMKRCPEVFVTGGASLFEQAAPHVDRLYLTRIHDEIDGEEHLPAFPLDSWQVAMSETYKGDDPAVPAHTFTIYERPAAG